MELNEVIAGMCLFGSLGATTLMAQDGNIVATWTFHGAAHQRPDAPLSITPRLAMCSGSLTSRPQTARMCTLF